MRSATLSRQTQETQIEVSINLDGTGRAEVSTGVGFFDHMLTHLAKHGSFDIRVAATGDLEVDAHHTVEDVGICLGQAFLKALGPPEGIARFGHAILPMDEALAEAAVDISGRPFLEYRAELPRQRVGEFDSELAEEFFRAFAMNGRVTLHVMLRYGSNVHHCIEVMFKSVARALRRAVEADPREQGVPSTKGTLQA